MGDDAAKLKKYEQIKLDVLTVLNIAAKFVTLDELNNNYKKLQNCFIPYADAGFDSVLTLLQSFPAKEIEFKTFGDVLHCKSIAKECFRHVTNLIKKTKGKSTKPLHYKKYPPHEKIISKKDENSLPSLKEEVRKLMMSYPFGLGLHLFSDAYAMRFGHYLNLESHNVKTISSLLQSMPDVVTISGNNNLILAKNVTEEMRLAPGILGVRPLMMPTVNRGERPKEDIKKEKAVELSSSERENIMKVLGNHPEGILSLEFLKIFQKETGSQLPKDWQQHGRAVKRMQSMSDVHFVEHNWFCWFFPTRASSGSTRLDSKRAEVVYMQTIRDFFYDVLFENPSGMTKDDVFALYRKHHGEDINLSCLGLTSHEFLICKMMDFVTTEYLGAGKASVKLKTYRDPELDALLDTKFILEDSALEGSFVHSVLKLPENFPIMVYEVDMSAHFYFQLHSRRKEIDELMDSLGSFYQSKSGDCYRVPSSYMKVGLLCAGKYEGLWHRCVVEKVVCDEVEIFYVDYGTRHQVSRNDLRFLRKKFMATKVQAFRGKLARITPSGPNRMLSEEAFNFFFAYICDKTVNSLLYTYADDGTILLDVHYHQPLPLDTLPEKMSKLGLKLTDVMLQRDYVTVKEEPSLLRIKKEFLQKMAKREKFSKEIKREVQLIEIPQNNVTKFIQLTRDYNMVLVNLNNTPYIASCDLSSFLWDSDVASTMILDGQTDRLKVYKRDHPELFSRLVAEIPRLNNGNDKRVCLTLFGLDYACEFLESVGHHCEKLKLEVQNAVDLFSPNDFYWTGCNNIELMIGEVDSFKELYCSPTVQRKDPGGEDSCKSVKTNVSRSSCKKCIVVKPAKMSRPAAEEADADAFSPSRKIVREGKRRR